MGACSRCGEPLPAPAATGAPRKWCSRKCGRNASAENNRRSCADCGGPMGPGSSEPARGRVRCAECHRKREAAAKRARLEDVAEMYREGMSTREIAATLGYGPKTHPPEITWARQAGLLDEYRYKAYEAKGAQ